MDDVFDVKNIFAGLEGLLEDEEEGKTIRHCVQKHRRE